MYSACRDIKENIFYSLGNSFLDIASPAYYKIDGTSDFVMHKKHFKYGRNSLLVEFDIFNKTVKSINKAYMENNRINIGKSVEYNKAVPGIYGNRIINNLMGYIRMLCLLLRSNFAVDGKIFSFKAIKKEFEFIHKRIWGSNKI